ncbi:MAG: MIP family protein [Minwuia thermotolerans]|nr:MAG: MIP family protein [Minwuia thermotolerans]
MTASTGQRLVAEALGTAILLATVVGSGIMGQTLAQGNDAIALLGNTIATGAILVVLIVMFGPLSGAHFNPAVTLVFLLRGEIPALIAAVYVLVQVAGGIGGVMAAHMMFEMDMVSAFARPRTGIGQWFAEGVATFGLVLTILGTVRHRPAWVGPAVGLYITAGYWFTASTSFANPAVTIARSLTGSFAGIGAADVPGFILSQVAGAVIAWAVGRYLFDDDD